jgi:uroporphyrinogen-III synthase
VNGLARRRVVNTRALHQAGALDTLLLERGAVPLSYPCIALMPVADTADLDAALMALANNAYDGLILTSANTVEVVAQWLSRSGLSLPSLLRIAAVGPATAQAAGERLGVRTDMVPDEHIAEALAEMLRTAAGERWLLPHSALADDGVTIRLSNAGVHVDAADAYTMGIGTGGIALLPRLREGSIDAVTFTSGSTVRNLAARLSDEGGSVADLNGVCIACIGPKSADAARSLGLAVDVMPDTYTIEHLVAALDAYFASATA